MEKGRIEESYVSQISGLNSIQTGFYCSGFSGGEFSTEPEMMGLGYPALFVVTDVWDHWPLKNVSPQATFPGHAHKLIGVSPFDITASLSTSNLRDKDVVSRIPITTCRFNRCWWQEVMVSFRVRLWVKWSMWLNNFHRSFKDDYILFSESSICSSHE